MASLIASINKNNQDLVTRSMLTGKLKKVINFVDLLVIGSVLKPNFSTKLWNLITVLKVDLIICWNNLSFIAVHMILTKQILKRKPYFFLIKVIELVFATSNPLQIIEMLKRATSTMLQIVLVFAADNVALVVDTSSSTNIN